MTASLPGQSGVDLQYVYAAGANNGQITQMNDVVSGEQVVYQYDALKRLIQAQTNGSGWGQSLNCLSQPQGATPTSPQVNDSPLISLLPRLNS